MTTHYVDLTVMPDAETGVPVLLGTLYDKLHRALVRQRLDSLGVSFPQYSVIPRNLGNTLRLHGSEAVLRAFLDGNWLHGMRDHVRVAEVAATPADALYRSVRRRQFKTNVERLRRRRMRRKGETVEQVILAIPDTAVKPPNLPYAHLRSLSTGQPFCLFIAMGPLHSVATPGVFNTYGLAESDATVPWF